MRILRERNGSEDDASSKVVVLAKGNVESLRDCCARAGTSG